MSFPEKPRIPSPAWVEFNGIQVTLPEGFEPDDTKEYVIKWDSDDGYYLAEKS